MNFFGSSIDNVVTDNECNIVSRRNIEIENMNSFL